MKKITNNIFITVLIFLSMLGPLLYIVGIIFDTKYSDLREKPRFLYLISPLPLLFDKKDFFVNPVIEYTLKNNKKILVKVSKEFLLNLEGGAHRRLHVMRLFSFHNFFPKENWYPAVRYLACNPEKLSMRTDKNSIKSLRVIGYYTAKRDAPVHFISSSIDCSDKIISE